MHESGDAARAIRHAIGHRNGRPLPARSAARSTSRRWSRRTPSISRRRVEFLCRAIDAAAGLGSDCVSLWSGVVATTAIAGATASGDGWSSGLADRCSNYAERRGVDDRLRARAGHVHRHDGRATPSCSTGSTRRACSSRSTSAICTARARRRSPTYIRQLGAAARQRPHRGHAAPASTST